MTNINKIEKLLETTGRIVCTTCYVFFLIWAYLVRVSFINSPLVIFGGLVIFGPYFLMFGKSFYDYLVCRFSKFKFSYIKYLLVLIVFIVPISYILIYACLSWTSFF